MDTTTVTMKAEDGTLHKVTVPTHVPTNERADYLRSLVSKHMVSPGHWKGPAAAVVPAELADDMAEAMEFIGALIDFREPSNGIRWMVTDGHKIAHLECPKGTVRLYSRGYWANGF